MEHVPSEPQKELSPNRTQHYQARADRLLSRYGNDFGRYTEGLERLVAAGDEVLRTREGTGYNILRSINDMPITSRKKLIFYSNYIRRTRHFGLLLAEMERSGILTPDQVRFGSKVSRVLFDGNWEPDPQDESISIVERLNEEGELYQQPVSQTVDTVAIFSPIDDNHARQISEKLVAWTDARMPAHIEGSWDIPDIRATPNLKEALTQIGFQEVRANILRDGHSRLLVARQETEFSYPWRRARMGMNPQLATYLASSDLGVKP